MTIADVKSGGWASHDLLTSGQMNAIRAELLKCVDGVGGGSYSPSADLIFGGAHELKIDSTLRMRTGGDFIVDSGGTFTAASGSTFTVVPASSFTGKVDALGDLEIGDDLIMNSGGSTSWPSGHTVHVAFLENIEVDDEPTTLILPSTWGVPTWDSIAVTPTWAYNGEWVTQTNDSLTKISFSLPIIPGDDIEAITVYVVGGAHGGSDPANKLNVQLHESNTAGVFSSVATLTDPATLGGYDAAHTVQLDSSTHPGTFPYTALNRQYEITILGENGANSGAGKNKIRQIKVETTRRQLVSHTTFGA